MLQGFETYGVCVCVCAYKHTQTHSLITTDCWCGQTALRGKLTKQQQQLYTQPTVMSSLMGPVHHNKPAGSISQQLLWVFGTSGNMEVNLKTEENKKHMGMRSVCSDNQCNTQTCHNIVSVCAHLLRLALCQLSSMSPFYWEASRTSETHVSWQEVALVTSVL